MTAGHSASARAGAILNIYRATAYSAVTPFVQLHIGDPGAAGTANQSANTTRNAVTFSAPTGANPVTMAGTIGNYTMTAAETITHVSIWSASTAGAFQESWPLTTGQPVINGSTFSFSTFALTITPTAA